MCHLLLLPQDNADPLCSTFLNNLYVIYYNGSDGHRVPSTQWLSGPSANEWSEV